MAERDLPSEPDRTASPASRWWGLLAFALGLVRTQTTTARGRTLATVFVVALTVANLLLVTGIALALADDGGVAGDADARIVSGDGGIHGSIAGAGEPRLGESRERAIRLADRDGIDHASPVLEEPIRVAGDGDDAYLALIGAVPGPDSATVASLPLEKLEGASDGDARLVLSRAAADDLGAEPGDRLVLEGVETRSATVVAVEDGPDEPVALVDLGVLQSLSGADEGGLADAVLVWGEGEAIRAGADAVYPDAALEGEGVPDVGAVFDDGLALAVVGALLGIVFGVAAIGVANAVAAATIAPGAIAAIHPLLIPYALAVAVVSTLLALPYPLALAARTDVLAEVGR
ncbi:hypothetical protein [Natronococcus jeotgali]|uniref:ABC transporter permease n=1 Tax=Natronococcus jeotgali DSM 18795 TaxID=1227498 RepID=L9X582_9EURY|nr:hypothetical protein [Natronococcus jeotgali]ELY55748.1 hypothetical protein C492_15776 [Natronococcus jeotgali DSM 18795]